MDLWDTPVPAGIDERKLVEMMRDIMNFDLVLHESAVPSNPSLPGGHTLERHVGKSDSDVIARFTNPAFSGNWNGSFFHGKKFAESLIIKAILSNLHSVYKWFYNEPGSLARLAITWQNNFDTGFRYHRSSLASPSKETVDKIYLILVRGPANSNGLTRYILTAYPLG